jgi:tetratricopeptide (TPR) repeat protein
VGGVAAPVVWRASGRGGRKTNAQPESGEEKHMNTTHSYENTERIAGAENAPAHSRCAPRQFGVKVFPRRIPAALIALVLLVCTGRPAAADAIGDLQDEIGKRPRLSAKDGLFRKLAAECLIENANQRGLDIAGRFIVALMGDEKDSRLDDRNVRALSEAADAGILLLQCTRQAPGMRFLRGPTEWLLRTDARMELFLETMSPLDNWPAALTIVQNLYEHDPEERDEFFGLILALAVVWDQKRPPPHPQMGEGQLPFSADAPARYDDFRQLFTSRQAEIPYRKLSVTALTYVVDLPMPLSEVAWIRENVSARNWKRKFFEIDYDEGRLERAVYQWPHGPYTMAAIEEKGGICVDQAYYAAMAARAYGVPALLFVGEGRRGPHAWYGYMKGTERWEMDIGRYAYDKYATGHALDPQTNRFMTDHDVTFACDRALRADRFRAASRFGRLAAILHSLGYRRAARDSARQSLDASPLYEFAWQILEKLEEEDEDWRGLVALYDTKAGVFRDYPDYLADIRRKQADVLRRLGDHDAAERLLRRQQSRVDKDRDDLARELTSDRVQAAYERGDYREARERFEDLLKDQKDEGQKIIPLVQKYLDLTRETKQTTEAARFMKRYIPSLERRYGNVDRNRILLLQLLQQAYQNDDDNRNVERVGRQIERLQK